MGQEGKDVLYLHFLNFSFNYNRLALLRQSATYSQEKQFSINNSFISDFLTIPVL